MQSNHSRIAEAVIEFARKKVEEGSPEFYIDTLRLFVLERTKVAPASPDRILRALRKEGVIRYTVVNRAKSLYNIYAVVDTIQDETIIETPVAEAAAPVASVEPKVCAVCGLPDCMYSFESLLQPPSFPAELIAAISPITVVSPTDIERGRKLIADLTAFVNEDTDASKAVWDVITALRGPDNGDYDVKEATTQRFRFATGFRQASTWTKGGFLISEGALPTDATGAERHFSLHYRVGLDGLKKLGII